VEGQIPSYCIAVVFWWGNLKERGQLQDLEVNERKIKIDLQEIRWNGGVWMHLAQNKGQSQGYMNMVMHLQAP
jgi:hypothetical protein